MVTMNIDAASETVYRIFCDLPIDLCKVGARVLKFRVQEFLDEFPVICKQQRSFAIMVKPASGVNPCWEPEFIQSAVPCFRGKLAQDTVRLIKENDRRHLTFRWNRGGFRFLA